MTHGVCLIGPGGAGGIQTCARLTAEELLRRGRHVRVLDSRGRWAVLSPFATLLAGLRLARMAASGQVDAAHLMASERMSLWRKGALVFWARMLGLRVILHHHGAELIPWARARGPLGRFWLRRAVGAADLNLVLGADWARFLTDEMGAPATRVRVLRNALPDQAPPRRLRLPGAPMRVLFMAVMTRRKGAHRLLAALADLAGRGVAAEAVFVGDGPERAAAMREAQALGLEIRFPGMASAAEAADWIAWADVLAHPSDHEGLPMTILEALRAGLPVLAAPAGAIAESLPDGAGLRHVPAHDERALASALEAMARRPDRRAALGRTGRRVFEARFRIEDQVDRLEDLYGWTRPASPEMRPEAAMS